MNIIDVLMIGLICLGALWGYKKGLISGVLNLIGTIAGFIIAAMGYAPLAAWAENHLQVKAWLEPIFSRLIESVLAVQVQANNHTLLESLMKLFPPQVWSILGDDAAGSLNSVTQNALQQVAQKLAETLTAYFLNLVAFAVIFLVIVLLAHIVAWLILKPLGILGGAVNRGGGFILGAVSILLILVVLAGLFSPLVLLEFGGTIGNLLRESLLYPYLFKLFLWVASCLNIQIEPQFWQQLSGSLFR
jgi:uncharacterized membrane protein required for colicin V production